MSSITSMKPWLKLGLGLLLLCPVAHGSEGAIEKQLAEIGAIQNEEVVVVQRKYTSKDWRHEFTPVIFGGVPFGTVRRTLLGGASYTLHFGDVLAWEAVNFSYTKTFFTSFADDINAYKDEDSNQPDIKPDYQKLLYFLTTGLQFTPTYGKFSTFSRWIAYIEPFVSGGAGLAKTEANSYLTGYWGLGIRLFFKEWFSMKLEFRDYMYVETFLTHGVSPQPASALRNNYSMALSLSFWLPKMP